jgi:hypothetical protein
MAYTKTEWVDREPPSINAENLNKIEQGIEDAHGLTEDGLIVGANATDSPAVEPGWETSANNMTAPDAYIKITVGNNQYVIPAWAVGA